MHLVMESSVVEQTSDAPARAGRPRDARLDRAIAGATFELISERGYQGLSLKAVAKRAGTTTPAIYRRWASKAELVLETVFGTAGPEVAVDTGDLEADVRTMIGWTLQRLGHPVGRAALAGLLAESADVQRALQHQLNDVWRVVGERLQSAGDAGDVRSDIDVAVQLAGLTGPAVVVALFQYGSLRDTDLIDELTSITLDGIRAQTTAPRIVR
jgi:AcrR family transcriptional regulator